MKKYLFGLIGVALLGGSSLLGQTPTPFPGGLGGVPAGTPALLAGPHGATCAPTKTACVPEHYVKKTTKVVYTCGSEPLCLPHCSGLFGHLGFPGHCGHPIFVATSSRRSKPRKRMPSNAFPQKCRPVSAVVATRRKAVRRLPPRFWGRRALKYGRRAL